MALGAVGVCCQKVSEAEVMVEGGIGDVLVSNEVAGAAKLDRLAALARAPRSACASTIWTTWRRWRRRRPKAGATLDVLVEIDVGGAALRHRARASRRRASREQVASVAALRFAGLQAYHGSAQHVREAAGAARAHRARGGAGAGDARRA